MTDDKCFECNSGTMVNSKVSLKGVRNGEEFTVSVPGLSCTSCGYQTIDNQQSGEFTKAVSDAYKRAHSLLTGAEIKERRSGWLGMSQQEFAAYLGVGVASVKRWESGQIQDQAMDQLIRLKTDLKAARNNLRALEIHIAEGCILSSGILGGQAIDLRVLCGQKYTERPQMGIGGVPFFTVGDDDVEMLVA